MRDPNAVTINVGCPGIEDATSKVVELKEKIMEARTLAGELASILGNLEFEVKV